MDDNNIVDMGKYVYVLDKKLGYGIAYLLNVKAINLKYEGKRVLSFHNNREFYKALNYIMSYDKAKTE